jgi:hypothetical protein
MKKFAFLICLLTLTNLLYAGGKSSYRKIPLGIHYYADLDVGSPIRVDPGFGIDAGWRLIGRESNKISKSVETDICLKPGFSFFLRKNYYNAIVLSAALSWRTTFSKGFFFELVATPGYMHKMYNADVYEYSNGTFEKKRASDPNLYLGGDLNVGYDFSKKKEDNGLGIIAGLGFFWRYPNNTQFVRHQYLKFGLTYTLRQIKS